MKALDHALLQSLARAEVEQHLIESYKPECLAAGYSETELKPYCGADFYFLATKIRHYVNPRTFAPYPNLPAVIDSDWVGPLQAMTKEQRAELRAKINFVPIGKCRR